MKKSRWAALAVAFQVLLVLSVPAAAQEEAIDCSLTSTGLVPIPDLGTESYQGEQGGLYPGGSNQIPEDHQALGLWRAAQIVPRNSAGEPDPDGTIGLLSIGVSNTRIEFRSFMRQVEGGVDSDVALVNGSQPGEDVSRWQDIDSLAWTSVETILANNGVTAQQVQAVWIKLPDVVNGADQILPFPEDAAMYRDQLAVVVRNAMDRYPNLQVAYLSSRIYAGYNTNGRPSPEPLAYENGFGVKWLIADQIAGDMTLNTDERRGPVEAPWLAWGPYLWADGLNARSDGLTWECGQLQSDGIHPAPDGAAKVGDLLISHFETEPTATPWFLPDGQPIGEVTLPPVGEVATTTTTTAPEETTTTTTTTTVADDVTTTTDRLSSSGRPGPPDRSDREEERLARAAQQESSSDDIGWLIGTVAVLAALLGAAAAYGYVRRRKGAAEELISEAPET